MCFSDFTVGFTTKLPRRTVGAVDVSALIGRNVHSVALSATGRVLHDAAVWRSKTGNPVALVRAQKAFQRARCFANHDAKRIVMSGGELGMRVMLCGVSRYFQDPVPLFNAPGDAIALFSTVRPPLPVSRVIACRSFSSECDPFIDYVHQTHFLLLSAPSLCVASVSTSPKGRRLTRRAAWPAHGRVTIGASAQASGGSAALRRLRGASAIAIARRVHGIRPAQRKAEGGWLPQDRSGGVQAPGRD